MPALLVLEGGRGSPFRSEELVVVSEGLRPWPMVTEWIVTICLNELMTPRPYVETINVDLLQPFLAHLEHVLNERHQLDYSFCDPSPARMQQVSAMREGERSRLATETGMRGELDRYTEHLKVILKERSACPWEVTVLVGFFAAAWLAALTPFESRRWTNGSMS